MSSYGELFVTEQVRDECKDLPEGAQFDVGDWAGFLDVVDMYNRGSIDVLDENGSRWLGYMHFRVDFEIEGGAGERHMVPYPKDAWFQPREHDQHRKQVQQILEEILKVEHTVLGQFRCCGAVMLRIKDVSADAFKDYCREKGFDYAYSYESHGFCVHMPGTPLFMGDHHHDSYRYDVAFSERTWTPEVD